MLDRIEQIFLETDELKIETSALLHLGAQENLPLYTEMTIRFDPDDTVDHDQSGYVLLLIAGPDGLHTLVPADGEDLRREEAMFFLFPTRNDRAIAFDQAGSYTILFALLDDPLPDSLMRMLTAQQTPAAGPSTPLPPTTITALADWLDQVRARIPIRARRRVRCG